MSTMGRADAEQETILLVDDNATNLQVLYQTLNGRSYKLLVAKSGEAALAVARKAHPALILLDIMMPGIDGYETCRRLKLDPETEDIAVIFLSALNESTDKVKGLDMGAVDYVAKPFQADEVIARVDTHLTIQRLRRSLQEKNVALEAANQRMHQDLQAAAAVQRAALPTDLPQASDLSFAWAYRPCEELGGDSLNVFPLEERYCTVYVLDVVGHGVPAALLSVALTRSLLPTADSSSLVTQASSTGGGREPVPPAEVARRLNAMYPMELAAQRYFTMVYGVYDRQTQHFSYVGAGHPGPVLLRDGQDPMAHEATGLPVGLMEDAEFEQRTLALEPGDRVFLHSDGVSEERNADGEQFGEQRVLEHFVASCSLPLEEGLDELLQAVLAWRGDERLRDDVSLLAFEVGALAGTE